MQPLNLYSKQGTIVVTALLPLQETKHRAYQWHGRYFVWDNDYGQHREVEPYQVVAYRMQKAGK